MFKIVDLSRSKNGFLVVIETDDPEELHLISFLKRAHEFSERYLHQIRRERKILDREENRPQRIAEASARRARILSLYRELTGTRAKKLSTIRELLRAQGEAVTLDRLAAALAIAAAERREQLAARIYDLRSEGSGWREIGRILALPESTARTLFKNRAKMSQDGRSPSRAGPRAPPYPISRESSQVMGAASPFEVYHTLLSEV